jgi:hypothetical protein
MNLDTTRYDDKLGFDDQRYIELLYYKPATNEESIAMLAYSQRYSPELQWKAAEKYNKLRHLLTKRYLILHPAMNGGQRMYIAKFGDYGYFPPILQLSKLYFDADMQDDLVDALPPCTDFFIDALLRPANKAAFDRRGKVLELYTRVKDKILASDDVDEFDNNIALYCIFGVLLQFDISDSVLQLPREAAKALQSLFYKNVMHMMQLMCYENNINNNNEHDVCLHAELRLRNIQIQEDGLLSEKTLQTLASFASTSAKDGKKRQKYIDVFINSKDLVFEQAIVLMREFMGTYMVCDRPQRLLHNFVTDKQIIAKKGIPAFYTGAAFTSQRVTRQLWAYERRDAKLPIVSIDLLTTPYARTFDIDIHIRERYELKFDMAEGGLSDEVFSLFPENISPMGLSDKELSDLKVKLQNNANLVNMAKMQLSSLSEFLTPLWWDFIDSVFGIIYDIENPPVPSTEKAHVESTYKFSTNTRAALELVDNHAELEKFLTSLSITESLDAVYNELTSLEFFAMNEWDKMDILLQDIWDMRKEK